MEKDTNYNYFIIPLSAIQRIYTHPQTAMNDLITIGISCLAKRVNTNLDDSLQQVLYCYYRDKKDLPDEIIYFLNDLIRQKEFEIDDTYEGFTYEGLFAPEESVARLKKYIQQTQDHYIADMILQFHKTRTVKKLIGVDFNTYLLMEAINRIKKYDQKGEPLILVKKDMLFEFRDRTKSAYERDMLACYLGIRSILGNKDLVRTTKQYIICRMIGVKSPKYINEALKNKALKTVYDKYSKRYQIDKLLDTLVNRKFVVKLPVPWYRCIYFSTRLNLNELVDAVYDNLTNNRKSKIEQTKKMEANAADRLYKRLPKRHV